MAGRKNKGRGKAPRKATAKRPHKGGPKAAAPVIVQMRFTNEAPPMKKNPNGKSGKKLHGAALAAYERAHGHHAGGHHGGHHAGGHAAGTRRKPRRNPRITFVQAIGKVVGAGAAVLGAGVVSTLAMAKLESMGYPNAGAYGVPLAVGLAGAAIATRAPLVGAGVAAGGIAAPFVLPVTSRLLAPPASTTTAGLRAVSMGSRAADAWRRLNPSRMSAVSMGRVALGRYAAHAT